MGPTPRQLKLEPDERERWRERGLSPCTVYATIKRDLFTSRCLQSSYTTWKGTESVSACRLQPHCFSRCMFVHAHAVCLWGSLAQTVLYKSLILCWNTGTVSHLKGHEISERLIFIIWSSLRKWLIFSAVVYRNKSLRLGLGWRRAFRQQVTVSSKFNYRQWWKEVTNYIVLYWGTNFEFIMLL